MPGQTITWSSRSTWKNSRPGCGQSTDAKASAPVSLHVLGALTVDSLGRTVTLHGQLVILTAQEFAVLLALIRRPGTIVSRARIEEALYSWDASIESNIIEVQIHRLRRKLGTKTIQTHRGLGYRLVEPTA